MVLPTNQPINNVKARDPVGSKNMFICIVKDFNFEAKTDYFCLSKCIKIICS